MILRAQLGRAKAALGASLLVLVAAACEEEGKTAPETCLTPPLEIYDIQNPPAEGGADAVNPCVTPIGHAVSPNGGTDAGGTAGNGGTAGSSSNGGSAPAAGGDSGGAPELAGAGGA